MAGGAISIVAAAVKALPALRHAEERPPAAVGQQLERTVDNAADADPVKPSGTTGTEVEETANDIRTTTVDVASGSGEAGTRAAVTEGASEAGAKAALGAVVGEVLGQVAGAVIPTTMGNGQPTPDGRLKYWRPPVAIPWNLAWPH